MLNHIIEKKKAEWLQREDCPVRALLAHMRQRNALRGTQIEAIETYLYLKMEGRNRPLWQLFAEGFFTNGTDLDRLNINQAARDFMAAHPEAFALYDFARQRKNGQPMLPELERMIVDAPDSVDYQRIIKRMFYEVDYADYLMSLPMGAGKTYLMAAFIYLDLYFAQNEPDNPAFAHNFLVLIPSGLKSSIVPSLRTIEQFDPSWLIPEPAASNLKRMLKFEVLDEAKAAKKSNKARNPNSQKVAAALADPFATVFVVNAEKVILDRVELTAQLDLVERTEDEQDKFANELRNLIGKIPHLSLLIDEVHHAATDDIKLRQVVNRWQRGGNITTVLGFSGTPYLAKPEKIPVVDDKYFKFTQIANTVYYYPLTDAIRDFLKKPKVVEGRNLDRFEVIRQGIGEFKQLYGNTVYGTGAIAKIAIYCSNIEVLEEEVYPFLAGELGIATDEILKFHKGNKKHPQPAGSELEFRSLDRAHSRKRYVLLVQVGKEGWDCPSLTGVILSQQGDSPKNMVLQTACRCLRQVDRGADETALIYLNSYNAKTLNEQLKKEQQTSIEELNALQRDRGPQMVSRHSRMGHLNLPIVDMYQMRVLYNELEVAANPDTDNRVGLLAENLDSYRTEALTVTGDLSGRDSTDIAVIAHTGTEAASFDHWLFELYRESIATVPLSALRNHADALRTVFDRITTADADGTRIYNTLYDRYRINSAVRCCFTVRRELSTESEVIPEKAELLIAEKLTPVQQGPRLYPEGKDVEKILHFDREGTTPHEADPAEAQRAYDTMKRSLEEQGMGNFVPPFEQFSKTAAQHSLPVLRKDLSFHYLPYNFTQSGLEQTVLEQLLALTAMRERGLEVYYNGERHLSSFVIRCYARHGKHWKHLGRYTTDFLIIQRKAPDAIHRVLMVETKGRGFATDEAFKQRRDFVEGEFLRLNNDKFGYARFDFLYIEDSAKPEANLRTIAQRIEKFFD